MGERKVINKYYPTDFDPRKLPPMIKHQQMKVRMMMPISIRCDTCRNYIYKGTKFNSRKEQLTNDTYLGISIFRFYFKCTKCCSEITFKTDPRNSDYIIESGATRNFEPWRAEDESTQRRKRERDAEETGNAIKCLENKTLESKKQMDIMVRLEELMSLKSRHANVKFDELLAAALKDSEKKQNKCTKRVSEKDSTERAGSKRTKLHYEESRQMQNKERARFIIKSITCDENTVLASLYENYKDDCEE